MKWGPLALPTVMVSLLLGHTAHANVAQPYMEQVSDSPNEQIHPAHLRGPATVEKEDLTIDCPDTNQCTFSAKYYLNNKTPKNITVAAGFIGGGNITATIGKQDVRSALPEPAVKRFQSNDEGDSCYFANASPAPVQGLRFNMPPQSKRTLEITGTLAPVNTVWISPDYSYTPAESRHPLSNHHFGPRSISFCYDLWPLRTWRGKPKINIQINAPEEAEIELRSTRGVRKLKNNTAQTLDGSKATKVLIAIPDHSIDLLLSHGPLIGLGYQNQGKQTVAQLGYEIMFTEFTGLQAGADYRLKDEDTAPWYLLEIASPGLLIIPQFGLGIGQSFAKEARGALRANLHLALGPAILGHQIDFPIDDAHPFRMWYLQLRF